jgi:hypothetical protein
LSYNTFSFQPPMKITGKRTFALSQLERFELLVIRAALNDFYKLEMSECGEGGITPQGEIALKVLNQINDYMDS